MPAKPRFHTKRTKRRKSYDEDVIATAKLLGFNLMPWQREMLGPAMEWRADGRPFHKTVVCTVPRQSGKSVLVAAVAAHWCMTKEDQHVLFLAQTRNAAKNRMQDVAVRLARAGVEGVKFRFGVGNERIEFENTGSVIKVESPTAKSTHGESLDLVVLDEGWALEDWTLQGVLPAMSAKPNSQLWVISTQGTEDSEVWGRYIDAGRESVTDRTSTTAYTEYAANLEAGQDIFNTEHWHEWMPALGITTSIEGILPSLNAMSPGEFMRAYGNV